MIVRKDRAEEGNALDTEQYIKERVDSQIEWFSTRSGSNQARFKQLRLAEIILASVIPLLTAYADKALPLKVIAGAVGVLVAIIAGTLALYKYQENWIHYRTNAETLTREKMLFLTRSGPYAGDGTFQEFVKRIESILGSENSQWAEAAKEPPK
jgi:hypothetical protein